MFCDWTVGTCRSMPSTKTLLAIITTLVIDSISSCVSSEVTMDAQSKIMFVVQLNVHLLSVVCFWYSSLITFRVEVHSSSYKRLQVATAENAWAIVIHTYTIVHSSTPVATCRRIYCDFSACQIWISSALADMDEGGLHPYLPMPWFFHAAWFSILYIHTHRYYAQWQFIFVYKASLQTYMS